MSDQSITVTIREEDVSFIQAQAKRANVSVDELVANLIGICRKALPQITVELAVAMAQIKELRAELAIAKGESIHA